MKVRYVCGTCAALVSELNLPVIDEHRLGFDVLTPEERADIISVDSATGNIRVSSLCDECIESLADDFDERIIH